MLPSKKTDYNRGGRSPIDHTRARGKRSIRTPEKVNGVGLETVVVQVGVKGELDEAFVMPCGGAG